jgi:hypothetical protein
MAPQIDCPAGAAEDIEAGRSSDPARPGAEPLNQKTADIDKTRLVMIISSELAVGRAAVPGANAS